jgi:hypothetical protein
MAALDQTLAVAIKGYAALPDLRRRHPAGPGQFERRSAPTWTRTPPRWSC